MQQGPQWSWDQVRCIFSWHCVHTLCNPLQIQATIIFSQKQCVEYHVNFELFQNIDLNVVMNHCQQLYAKVDISEWYDLIGLLMKITGVETFGFCFELMSYLSQIRCIVLTGIIVNAGVIWVRMRPCGPWWDRFHKYEAGEGRGRRCLNDNQPLCGYKMFLSCKNCVVRKTSQLIWLKLMTQQQCVHMSDFTHTGIQSHWYF